MSNVECSSITELKDPQHPGIGKEHETANGFSNIYYSDFSKGDLITV